MTKNVPPEGIKELLEAAEQALHNIYLNSQECREGITYESWRSNRALEVTLIKMKQQEDRLDAIIAKVADMEKHLQSHCHNINTLKEIFQEMGVIREATAEEASEIALKMN